MMVEELEFKRKELEMAEKWRAEERERQPD